MPLQKVEDNKAANVFAYKGFDLCNIPYTQDDIFAEPTQKRLSENTFYDYVPLLTFGNDVLDSLYLISSNSPTVSRIITQKTEYTTGAGFVALPKAKMQPLSIVAKSRGENTDVDITQAEALNDFMLEVNMQGETLEDVTRKIANELWSFGNCFLEVFYTSTGLCQIRVLSTYLCRPKKAAENKLYPEYIGVSEDWQEDYVESTDVVDYPIYPKFENINGAMRSIVHFKIDAPNLYYWGRPEWIGAKIWGELEYRIAKWNQAKFENGFTPSAIVSLFGMTNSEEAGEVVEAMKSCFTGTGNNAKMFIQALRDETYKADVQILNNQNEGEFELLAKLVTDKIVTGFGTHPSLVGVATAGTLGTNQQIRSEFDIFFRGNIRPMQRRIMSKLNKVLDTISEVKGNAWNDIALDLKKLAPVGFEGDLEVMKVLTVDEMRQELGKEPLNNNTIAE